MKLLFVTGGDDCECKGEGKVLMKAHPRDVNPTIRSLCHCVVAKEATIEIDSIEGTAIRHAARIVPKVE